jgi:hypothetical protein
VKGRDTRQHFELDLIGLLLYDLSSSDILAVRPRAARFAAALWRNEPIWGIAVNSTTLLHLSLLDQRAGAGVNDVVSAEQTHPPGKIGLADERETKPTHFGKAKPPRSRRNQAAILAKRFRAERPSESTSSLHPDARSSIRNRRNLSDLSVARTSAVPAGGACAIISLQ